ncbi:MAG: hypothetical protein MK212_05535 [Saprospiraceae bacterium]|nr:hypothetical protein [Saprospiraceae bacterium]
MKNKGLQHTAIFMALLILISSVGVSSYSSLCICTGKITSSILWEASPVKDNCCSKKEQKKCRKADQPKSCCSVKHIIPKNNSCQAQHKDCHETDIEYQHLSIDAEIQQVSFSFSTVHVLAFLPDCWKGLGNHLVSPDYLPNSFVLEYPIERGPPLPYGRSLLKFQEIYRC